MALVVLLAGAVLVVSSVAWRPGPALEATMALPTAHVLDMPQRPLPADAAQRALLPTSVASYLPPTALPHATGLPAAGAPASPTITPVPLPEPQPQPDAAPLAPVPAPVAAPAAPAQAGPLPIVMYHYVRVVDAGSDPLGYELSVAPELFAQQMAWLYEQGYATVTMATAVRCLRGEPACPPQAVALTFDDGYFDAYSEVLPVLQHYGFTATFYIVGDFVGQPGYMGWEQLATLRDAGMEIGAHSISHPDLTTLDAQSAAWQISESKARLERELGVVVTSFCYPAGRYNAAVAAQVAAAGFSNATTTRWDADYSDVFGLPRRRVAGGADLSSFVALVRGY